MSAPPTWTRPDAAHDDLHSAALARSASVLSRRAAAGADPGPVALTAAARALLPDGPLGPVAVHCNGGIETERASSPVAALNAPILNILHLH